MNATSLISRILHGQVIIVLLTTIHMAFGIWPKDKAKKFDTPNTKEDVFFYDYIIVGGGTAGGILANQLSDDKNNKVALFEAGGKPTNASLYPGSVNKLPHSSIDWNFTSKYEPCSSSQFEGNVFQLTSGKVLGGDSSMGYMVYARGSPRDLELTAQAANDYSYDYNCMISYFKKSERLEDKEVLDSPYGFYYGKNGSIGMARQPQDINKKYLKAFEEMNKKIVLDTNGPDTTGFAEPMFMISGGKRQSTALTSLAPAAGRDNLDVFFNTKVIKILINGNNTAVGVQAKTKDGKIVIVIARKEVIVCAGVYKSPQLLMLSGLGVKETLQLLDIPVIVDLPVGKYYQDHAGIFLNIKLNSTTDDKTSYDPFKFPLPTIIGYDTSNNRQPYPDFRVRMFALRRGSDVLGIICRLYGFKDGFCKDLVNQTTGFEVMSMKIAQLHPISRGEVTIRSSNPDDDPVITQGYFSNKTDLDVTVDYILQFLKIQDTATFKKYNASFVYPKMPECDMIPRISRDYWNCLIQRFATTIWDGASSCRIGSVVDNHLRVFQILGLRVVDASVLPNVPSAGLQAQVMAIAYKAADMILQDNKYKN